MRHGIRLWFSGIVLAVVVLTGGGEMLSRALAPDRVQIRVTDTGADYLEPAARGPERIVFARTVTDPTAVSQAAGTINSLPALPLGGAWDCPIGANHPYDYRFTFMWHGLTVETARVNTSGCGFWQITRGGIPDLSAHAGNPSALSDLAAETGMPVPQP